MPVIHERFLSIFSYYKMWYTEQDFYSTTDTGLKPRRAAPTPVFSIKTCVSLEIIHDVINCEDGIAWVPVVLSTRTAYDMCGWNQAVLMQWCKQRECWISAARSKLQWVSWSVVVTEMSLKLQARDIKISQLQTSLLLIWRLQPDKIWNFCGALPPQSQWQNMLKIRLRPL